jgi:LmbE family N-acetylglucosaminyl deacetylase
MKTKTGTFVFISPHLDDVIFSCGEFISKLSKEKKDILVITVFSGKPIRKVSNLAKNFHNLWGLNSKAVEIRKIEDENAMKLFGIKYYYIDEMECIYRFDNNSNYIYFNVEDITSNKYKIENNTIERIKNRLYERLNTLDIGNIFVPLGIGRHVDHIIVRKCVEEIFKNNSSIYYYEDIPYVHLNNDLKWKPELINGLDSKIFEIAEDDWILKLNGIKCYESQISISWGNIENAKNTLSEFSMKYLKDNRSIRFWINRL